MSGGGAGGGEAKGAEGEAEAYDLTGTFDLDWHRSDNLDAFFKELGVPWLVRKAANQMSPTQILEHTSGGEDPTIHIMVKSVTTEDTTYKIKKDHLTEKTRADRKKGLVRCWADTIDIPEDVGTGSGTVPCVELLDESEDLVFRVLTHYFFCDGHKNTLMVLIDFFENREALAKGEFKVRTRRYFDRRGVDKAAT